MTPVPQNLIAAHMASLRVLRVNPARGASLALRRGFFQSFSFFARLKGQRDQVNAQNSKSGCSVNIHALTLGQGGAAVIRNNGESIT